MSYASRYVKKLTENNPSRSVDANGSRIDRAQQLYAVLEPDLPECLRLLNANRKLVIAEIGDVKPDACCQSFRNRDGSFAITFNSGFMKFFYAVARYVGARTVVHIGPGKSIPAVLTDEEGVTGIHSVFLRYRYRGNSGPWLQESPSLHPAHIQFAEGLTQGAELFTLAHELGHAYLLLECPPFESESEESDADLFAARLAARNGLRRRTSRMAYAGALFSLRVHACLERVGHKFSDTHLPPTQRLEAVESAVRELCQGGENEFESLSRMAVSIDEFMESVEHFLLQDKSSTKQTPRRLVAKISALLEEVSKGNVTLEGMLAKVTPWMEGLQKNVIREAAQKLRASHPLSKALETKDARVRLKAEGLLWLAGHLPEPSRTSFGGAKFFKQG